MENLPGACVECGEPDAEFGDHGGPLMSDLGIHAKPGDVLVGRLSDPIGMYRDEVYLRDLSPEAQALLKAGMDYEQPQQPDGGDFGESDLKMAARAFAKAMGVKPWP